MFKTGLPTREWEIEYLRMMVETDSIICFAERGMTDAEQKQIIKFVIDNSDSFNTISFRLLDKVCGFYKEMPNTWKDFSLMTLS